MFTCQNGCTGGRQGAHRLEPGRHEIQISQHHEEQGAHQWCDRPNADQCKITEGPLGFFCLPGKRDEDRKGRKNAHGCQQAHIGGQLYLVVRDRNENRRNQQYEKSCRCQGNEIKHAGHGC